MSSPIELLEKQVDSLQSDIDKSGEACSKGLITKEEHNGHLRNIEPKMNELKSAISCLQEIDMTGSGDVQNIISHTCRMYHDTGETSNDREARLIIQALKQNGFILKKILPQTIIND